jgi:hypothetical protein
MESLEIENEILRNRIEELAIQVQRLSNMIEFKKALA